MLFFYILLQSPTFQRLGHLLRKRELVMQWIQRQENHNVKAVLDAVFSLLQKYSTLNVLHQSGALVHSNSTEIQELLEKCNQGLTKDSWESITFQGFCILTKAMNLFYLAGKINGTHTIIICLVLSCLLQYQVNPGVH